MGREVIKHYVVSSRCLETTHGAMQERSRTVKIEGTRFK